MKILRYSLLCLWPMALCPMPAAAQQAGGVAQVSAVGKDPSALYLEAWFCMEDADKLSKGEDYMGAVGKAQKAESILSAIARDHPDWQKNMVFVRRQTNSNNMGKWVQLAKENPVRIQSPSIAAVENGNAGPVRPNQPPAKTPSFDELEQKRLAHAQSPGIVERVPHPISSPTLSEPRTPYERLESELLKREFENKALVQALKGTQKKLIDAMAEKNKADTGQSVYKERYEELSAQIAKERIQDSKLIETLTQKFNEVEAEWKKAVARNEEADKKIAQLQAQLNQTNDMLAKVTRERDSLKTERDELAAIVEFNSPEKTKILLDNNLTLAHKLKEAEEKILKLEGDRDESGNQIAANIKELEETRAEVTQTKIMLAALRDENTAYRRRISELNTKLVNAEAELDKLSKQPKTDPVALEENKLLRTAISKQMMVLTTQQKGRDLLIQEFRKLNLDNPEIDEALNLLEDEEKLQLTDAEKALVQSFSATPQGATESSNESSLSGMGDTVRKQLELEAIGRLASRTFAQGDFAASEQLYRTLLQDQPDNYAVRVNLGTTLIKLDRVDEALEHLKRANELSPNTAPVYSMMGIAAYRKGADKEAMEAFRQATTLEPDNIEAYWYMGNIERTAGNLDQAVACFDNALKIKADLPDILFNKASTLADAGKLPEARRAYDLAIQAGAAPDLELQHILDPNSSPLPALAANSTRQPQPGSTADAPSPTEDAPGKIATVDSQPQQNVIKDATSIPTGETKVDKPAEPAPVQMVSNINEKPDNTTTAPPKADVTPAQPDKPKADAPAPAQVKPPENEKPTAPKNRRWFRFG